MQIGLVADKEHTINHDLNFQQSRYESKHTIVRSTRWCIRENNFFWRGLLSTLDIQAPQASSARKTTRIWPCARWREWRKSEARSDWWGKCQEEEEDRKECSWTLSPYLSRGVGFPNYITRSTWTNLQTAFKGLVKTTYSESSRWSTTTKRQTHIQWMMLSVSQSLPILVMNSTKESQQKANFTSICTHYQIPSSRCYGTLCNQRALFRTMSYLSSVREHGIYRNHFFCHLSCPLYFCLRWTWYEPAPSFHSPKKKQKKGWEKLISEASFLLTLPCLFLTRFIFHRCLSSFPSSSFFMELFICYFFSYQNSFSRSTVLVFLSFRYVMDAKMI